MKMFESRMVYRILMVCLMVLIMIAGIYVGTKYIAKSEVSKSAVDVVNDDNIKVYGEEDDKKEEKDIKENKEEDLIVTYVDIYSECGHRKEGKAVHIHGNIDKVKENIEGGNDGYELMGEEDGLLIFERVYGGSCTDHYKVGINNGKICVYKINEKGEYDLYQTLEIDLETVREDVKEQLENEVVLDSLEELFVFLEDIES